MSVSIYCAVYTQLHHLSVELTMHSPGIYDVVRTMYPPAVHIPVHVYLEALSVIRLVVPCLVFD